LLPNPDKKEIMTNRPTENRPPEATKKWLQYIAELENSWRPFEEHWEFHQKVYADWNENQSPPPAWQPSLDQIANSNIGRFMHTLGLTDFHTFHRWSVEHRAEFWRQTIEQISIRFQRHPDEILKLDRGVKNPDWLLGAELNITDSCFQAGSDQVAIIWGKEGENKLYRLSYRELENLTGRIANGLVEQGIKAGDGLAIYMPMTVECIGAYLAIVRLGGRVISIADSFSADELGKRLKIGQAQGIICVDGYVRAGKRIDLYAKVKEASAPRAFIIPDDPSEKVEGLRTGDMIWSDLLSDTSEFDSVIGGPERISNILFSSGTTGTPKAIPWTHLTPIKCAMDGHFHQDIQSQDVVCWPTNIGWMMGPWLVYASLLNKAAIALYVGMPVGEGFTKFVHKSGVNVLGVIPSLVKAWRKSGWPQGPEWNQIRVMSSTGEPSNQEDYLWLMSRTGYRAPVIEYMGGTEIGGGYLTGTVVQAASLGTFTTPALGIDVLVLDENNQPVTEKRMGEAFLIPPSIGLSQVLLNKDHEDVYYTGCPVGPHHEVLRCHGDQVLRLPGGYYRALGRADDSMNLGGIKVSSMELEQVINDHPAVFESAAVAVRPGGEGADQLVVYAVPSQPMESEVLHKELGRKLAKKLNPLFKIFDLVIDTKLPRTSSNKLMRRKLREYYMEKNNS
jgi:acetyl-CoA synthetase